jgi:hypothetical protein
MAVKYDRAYPRKDSIAESVSLLTDVQIRDSIIEKLQAGKGWTVASAETSSAATGTQVRPVARVMEIAKQLKEDVAALRALSPLDYSTASEFLAAMNGASQILPVSEWITHLQDAYDIPGGNAAERFAALKAKLTPEA